MCLGRFLGFIRGTFRLITLVDSGVNMPIDRGVLVPLASVAALLVMANNVCKYIFI